MQKDMNKAMERIDELQNEVNNRFTIQQVDNIISTTVDGLK